MDGRAADLLGVQVDGFPNMLMLMGPHTALGNIPRSIEYNVDWVTRPDPPHARARPDPRRGHARGA